MQFETEQCWPRDSKSGELSIDYKRLGESCGARSGPMWEHSSRRLGLMIRLRYSTADVFCRATFVQRWSMDERNSKLKQPDNSGLVIPSDAFGSTEGTAGTFPRPTSRPQQSRVCQTTEQDGQDRSPTEKVKGEIVACRM